MNERIRRIMEQAIISVDGQLFGKTYVPDEFTEKFAELILLECNMALQPILRDMISRGEACDLINKHFGVKDE